MATEIDSDCLNGVMKGELHFDTVRIPSVVLYFYVFFFSYVHLGDRCHSIPLHQTTIPPNCSWLACWHDEWRPSLPR